MCLCHSQDFSFNFIQIISTFLPAREYDCKVIRLQHVYIFHIPQYVGRFNEHGRMYSQRHGGKSQAPGKQVFSCYFIELQLLYQIFKKSVDGIIFSVFFSIRKRILVTLEIELIHVCARGRKTCIFNPFSSTSSEIGPKILQCLINSPVQTHRRKPYSVSFSTVVFLFSDSKPYDNKQACFAGGVGFHGLNGRPPH